MTATFGKLQNETLALQPGLNCIYAPNESGKSTWTRFLLNMFYGVNTRDRSPYADKTHYQPWAGGAMQGTMDLVHEDRAYTITRTTRRATAPMGNFAMTYQGTGDQVAGITAADAGEWLLGVPREVYERSAFIAQSGLAVQQDAELERRIAALITTGEEDVSYSETYKALRDQRNRRKYNRTGLIPTLESQCRTLEQELRDLADLEDQRQQAEERLRTIETNTKQFRDYDRRWQILESQQKAAQLLQRRATAEQRLQELRERAVKDEAICSVHPLHGVSAEELDKRLHPEPPKKPLSTWIGTLLMVAAVPLALLDMPPAAAYAVFFLGGAISVFLAYLHRKYKTTLDDQQRTVDALRSQIAEYDRLKETAQRSRDDWSHDKQLYDDLPPAPAIDQTYVEPPPIPHTEVQRQLFQANEDTIRCRTQLDTTAGRLAAAGNVADKRSLLQQNREQLAALQREYDAITLAMEALDEANQVIQNRFSPALGVRAAEIFSRLTGGRYEKVTLSRTFDLAAATADDAALRPLPLLSQGAADQLYLAVRLAICEMVLPAENAAPLVLDDALLTFDAERMAAALDVLLDMSKTRQILLFTCQHREQNYLSGKPNTHLVQI